MKLESTLPDRPYFVHIAAVLDLVIVVLVITMASTKIGVSRGIEIQLPKSQYILSQTPNMATITVSGGSAPVFFLNNERITSLPHLESALDKMKTDVELVHKKSQIFVVLRMDGSVSRSLEQQLIELVLSRGMTCALAADPLS